MKYCFQDLTYYRYLETRTVQAPHEPSPQESFDPVRPDDLRYWRSVVLFELGSFMTWVSLFIQKVSSSRFFIMWNDSKRYVCDSIVVMMFYTWFNWNHHRVKSFFCSKCTQISLMHFMPIPSTQSSSRQHNIKTGNKQAIAMVMFF